MHLDSIEAIGRNYRHIYLSPHYDDAVLSCGGTIALQRMAGQRALVVTIFGGAGQPSAPLSAFAAQSLSESGLGTTATEAVQRRREEDAAACEVVGADTLWLDFPDALYRDYTSRESLFGGVVSTDLALEEQIAALLLEIRSRAPLAVIYAPLGVGHHVDHQLVCSAADRLAQQETNIAEGVKPGVKFYEDFPYVASPGALADRQRELGLKMEAEMVEISAQKQQKIEAIACYGTQVPGLFGTEDKMRQTVESYCSSIRRQFPGIQIERYWHW